MKKLKEKLIRFMYGRNGMDAFNIFLFSMYFVLIIFSWISAILLSPIFYTIISSVLFLIGIYMVFRMFSKNIVKRQIENRRYLSAKNSVSGFFKLQKNKYKDRKTHIYKKCPYCKSVLRLKRIKGKHRAACPKCSNSFEIYVR